VGGVEAEGAGTAAGVRDGGALGDVEVFEEKAGGVVEAVPGEDAGSGADGGADAVEVEVEAAVGVGRDAGLGGPVGGGGVGLFDAAGEALAVLEGDDFAMAEEGGGVVDGWLGAGAGRAGDPQLAAWAQGGVGGGDEQAVEVPALGHGQEHDVERGVGGRDDGVGDGDVARATGQRLDVAGVPGDGLGAFGGDLGHGGVVDAEDRDAAVAVGRFGR